MHSAAPHTLERTRCDSSFNTWICSLVSTSHAVGLVRVSTYGVHGVNGDPATPLSERDRRGTVSHVRHSRIRLPRFPPAVLSPPPPSLPSLVFSRAAPHPPTPSTTPYQCVQLLARSRRGHLRLTRRIFSRLATMTLSAVLGYPRIGAKR
jgi:hypothetical protein